MKINASKTKHMKFSRKYDSEVKLMIDHEGTEYVKEFRNLGALIKNDGWKYLKEIKYRIVAGKTFHNLSTVATPE